MRAKGKPLEIWLLTIKICEHAAGYGVDDVHVITRSFWDYEDLREAVDNQLVRDFKDHEAEMVDKYGMTTDQAVVDFVFDQDIDIKAVRTRVGQKVVITKVEISIGEWCEMVLPLMLLEEAAKDPTEKIDKEAA